MIEVGARGAFDFEVKAIVGGERWEGAFLGLVTRPSVVSVYMRNNTSSCDRQVEQLNVVARELDKLGYGVIAVSRDTIGSQAKYARKHGLAFPLVSDPDYTFAAAVDSLVEKKLYGRVYTGPTRSAYLIDPTGTVIALVEKVDSSNHADQLRELVGS